MVRKKFKWHIRDAVIELNRTCIMGILNVTPDSFSDGGRFFNVNKAVDHALQMESKGADIIDIGGESTKPGAKKIKDSEELDRVLPVIEQLRTELKIPISIDTWKSHVAGRALEAGANIVNDISGLMFDPEIAWVIAAYNAGIVLMHIQGTPQNMQQNPHYEDIFQEITDYLDNSVTHARNAGIKDEYMVIDPGIGFGKTREQNFEIIAGLQKFKTLNKPILVGPSRKSFIGSTLNLPADQRLEGTIAAVTASILNGAHIVRVHDIEQIKRAVDITDKILEKMNESDPV